MPIHTALYSRCLCALLYCTLGDVYTALHMYDSTMYSSSTMYAQFPFLVAARPVLLLVAARSVLLLFCCTLSAAPPCCALSAPPLLLRVQCSSSSMCAQCYSIVSASAGFCCATTALVPLLHYSIVPASAGVVDPSPSLLWFASTRICRSSRLP